MFIWSSGSISWHDQLSVMSSASASLSVRLHCLIKQYGSFSWRTQLRPQRAASVQLQHLLQMSGTAKCNLNNISQNVVLFRCFKCLCGVKHLVFCYIKQVSPLYICNYRLLTVRLRKTISVDSLASAPPFQYNFLTSSDVSEQLRTQKKMTLRYIFIKPF